MSLKRPILVTLLAIGWGIAMFFGGWALRGGISSPNGALGRPAPQAPGGPSPSLLDEAWSKVRESYVGQVPSDTLRNYGAVRGAIQTLNDRFSIFIEPQIRAVERDQQRGSFGGVGATLFINDEGQIVLTPIRDAPAEKAGLKANDILLAIDGVPLAQKPELNEVLLRIRGDVGSIVNLTVGRGADRYELRIVRAVIETPSTTWRIVTTTAGAKAGVIAIQSFTARTPDEVKRAINELRRDGAAGLVLDLRDNGGGLLNASIEVASQFIADGVVLLERRREQPDVSFRASGGGLATSGPLIALVNANSASASEIVAGALQDNGRAKLVGTKTYGKGSAQYIYDLSDGSSVHITFAKWYTPKGRSIDGVGLIPDIDAPRAEDEARRGQDSQLTAALALLFP
ncbi:MAG: S41 family peptidase [Thermoflexales bacterium]